MRGVQEVQSLKANRLPSGLLQLELVSALTERL